MQVSAEQENKAGLSGGGTPVEMNLFLVYPLSMHAFSLPGLFGCTLAYSTSSSDQLLAKVHSLANAQLGPLYLGFYALKIGYLLIVANLAMTRRPTGVNVPDQHIYKVVKGVGEGSIVLMDDKHELYGPFNRAQRALQNLNEVLASVLVDALMVGYVFPTTVAFCLALFSLCRVRAATLYTAQREKRVFFQMLSNVVANSLGGMALITGLYTLYLQLSRG
mmetsp:Transcript_26650/g.61296  ORF Transcript_26650/g.61296 Transcript_26650/m.61296 type:complete len:220 (-) Transcript_26650:49-708(-)